MRTPHRLGVFAIAGVLAPGAGAVIFGQGCAATDEAPPEDAGPFEAGDAAPTPPCPSCLRQECLGAWATCLLDPGCRALRVCASGGEDCSCGAGAGPSEGGPGDGGALDSRAAYAAFAACNASRAAGTCATACASATVPAAPACPIDAGLANDPDGGAPDGGDAATGAPPVDAPSPDACAGCFAGRCGDARRACALGSECAAYLGCVHACAEEACVAECESRYATGRAAAEEVSSCTLTSCSGACGL